MCKISFTLQCFCEKYASIYVIRKFSVWWIFSPYNIVISNVLVFVLEGNLACARLILPCNVASSNMLMFVVEGMILVVSFHLRCNVVV